jgi:2,4-dienoyl-CoA reductase-like NADH-dependent reductase (Old Yellow Enzyme family)
MSLSNRFVRSATWEGMATEDGACTAKLVELMTALAEGGVGLIISGHAYVSPEGQAGPWQLGIYRDELIPGLESITTAVHEKGAKIAAQLAHAGCFAAAKLTGQPPMAASILDGFGSDPQQEMTVADIQKTVAAFGAAAQRAREAGFDGVQIHSAHGYLLSQFLSPAFNRREDQYGGNIHNRARFLIEVLGAIRAAVGNAFPVLVKINCQDFIENGLTLEDSLQVGSMLTENGIDAIELSGGVRSSGKLIPSRTEINSEDKEAYFRQEALSFKKQMNVPLILVGGNRSFQVSERLIDEGAADYISLCRPLIREPDLINRWKSGDLSRATCLSDNMCFIPARKGAGIYCLTEEKQNEKKGA